MQGKQYYQKMKPYIIFNYLMRFSDEEHPVSTNDIIAYLQEVGISAERRSVYRDIQQINIALYIHENIDATVDEAIEVMEDDNEKIVVYDEKKKGYYVNHRDFEFDDIRLLTECIYAAKFVDEKRANNLINVIDGLVSESQAERIKHDVLLVDRIKTTNTNNVL